MLTRKTPETLATELEVKGQGETFKFNVVYYNRTQTQIQDVLDKGNASEQAKTDVQYANRQAALFVIKSFESEYALTDAGLKEMEIDRPGMIEILFFGFHKARRVELGKN